MPLAPDLSFAGLVGTGFGLGNRSVAEGDGAGAEVDGAGATDVLATSGDSAESHAVTSESAATSVTADVSILRIRAPLPVNETLVTEKIS